MQNLPKLETIAGTQCIRLLKTWMPYILTRSSFRLCGATSLTLSLQIVWVLGQASIPARLDLELSAGWLCAKLLHVLANNGG